MFIDLPELKTSILFTPYPQFEDLKIFLMAKKQPYSGVVIISDTNVFPLYEIALIDLLKSLRIPSITSIILDPGESSKNLDTAKTCWEEMHRARVDRQSLVIGLGGGTITDLAGFVAACYMRGLDVIHIPTTLMGMVDAAIGGKTGVNISSGKNIVGVIHQPKLVLISPTCLESLPDREFIAGLAEIVKYGILVDPYLFEILENEAHAILFRDPKILEMIIQRCCRIKADIVQKDEKEHGIRALLNLGHTFGHAIEAATNYSIYLHGEAVSIGMSCAFYTSHALGMIDESLIIRLHALLKKLKLPIALPDIPPMEHLIDLMYGDKKTSGGKLNLILVKNIGEVEQCLNVDPEVILKALNDKKLAEDEFV